MVKLRSLVGLISVLFFVWVLGIQPDADARPGGGQNYRAPSSSSSRSYSSPSRSYSGSSSSSSRSYSGSSSSSSSYSSSSRSSSPSVVYVPSGGTSSSSDGCGAVGWIVVLVIV